MARFEVISGVERHRRRSDSDRLSIVREAFTPGAVVAAVARRHDIRVQQIYYWRKKFGMMKPSPMFLPVSVFDGDLSTTSAPQAAAIERVPTAAAMVEVCLRNGRGLKVPADLERQTLASLIACVEAA